jgi:branched-chain amino acid transport system ATP-binding protein
LGTLEAFVTTKASLLQVQGLTKRFDGVTAVNSVNLEVKQGEIVALIGPNGAGKTTLFGMVTGFLKPSAGKVYFRGADITRMPPYRRGLLGIVCTFQKTAIFPDVTVLQAVRMGQHRKTSAGVVDALIGSARHQREESATKTRAAEILDFVGLGACADQRAGSLSYGQQRLVELAIALAAEPELLLLDEPAAGLNATESAELANVIRAVRDRGTTVFLVEHDMSVIMEVCDRIYVIAFGEKIAEGRPEEIQENEAVIDAYLGSAHVAA